MKKLVCVAIALLLIGSVALAEGVNPAPSITMDDLMNQLTNTHVFLENMPDGAPGFFLEVINEYSPLFELPEYQHLLEINAAELSKLQSFEKAEDYFGGIRISTGETLTLSELFGDADPYIYEFYPIVAGGFHMEYGNVTALMQFATPYAEGQQVLVMIGDIVDKEDENEIVWYGSLGTGVRHPEYNNEVFIEATFGPELMTVIQEEDTLIAIASEEVEF